MNTDELEVAAAKLKGLDNPSNTTKPQVPVKPHKDVNTFFNNQLKFVSTSNVLPRDKKCNLLKDKMDSHAKSCELPVRSLLIYMDSS